MEKLIEEAKRARLNAYAPYSKFLVGAAIKVSDGTIITGCNVENISYGLTICAERNALFKMVSEGYKKEDAKMMVIIGDTDEPITPCGACRQVMAELLDNNCIIYLANLKNNIKKITMEELLPYGFKELK